MKLNELLSNQAPIFDNATLQAAVEEKKAAKVKQLTNDCIRVMESSENTIKRQVSTIRYYRKYEKEAKEALQKVLRAKAFLAKTGNPIPLIQLVDGQRYVDDLCYRLGLELPDAEGRKVPADFADEDSVITD
jgi:hypothetical protein